MAYREEFREVPFWRRDGVTTTSCMLQDIVSFCRRYQGLSAEKKKWALDVYAGQAYAEFLFQVNHIEGEGFETLEATQEAIAGGALQWHPGLEDDVDDRLKHVSNLHAALCSWFALCSKENDIFESDRLLQSHHLLLASVRPQIAGRFRNPKEVVYVEGRQGRHYFLSPEKVVSALSRLMQSARKQLSRALAMTDEASRVQKLFTFAGDFFFKYESIHPFVDGNGRTGRIMVARILHSVLPFPNVLLIDDGKRGCGHQRRPPFVDRQDYLKCFSIAQGSVDSVPRDLTALLVEGVYVGWKRFFAALDSAFPPPTPIQKAGLKRERFCGRTEEDMQHRSKKRSVQVP